MGLEEQCSRRLVVSRVHLNCQYALRYVLRGDRLLSIPAEL